MRKLLIISSEKEAAKTYFRYVPLAMREQIEAIQADSWRSVRGFMSLIGEGSVDAIIATALPFSDGPTTLGLIEEIRRVFAGPIIVIGRRRGRSLDWVTEATKAGASHAVEQLTDMPKILTELINLPADTTRDP